jgi:penicillin-binding protein 2
MKKKISTRTFFILFVFLVLYLTLVCYFFYLNIIKGKYFLSLSNNNFFKIRNLYSARGDILDRNNEIIVTNQRKFRLILMIKKKAFSNEVFNNIENLFDIETGFIKKKNKHNYFTIVKIFDNMKDLNLWKYNNVIEDNVILEEFWHRHNLYVCFNHLMGYIQYNLNNEKPLKGLEKAYNFLLEGKIVKQKIFMDTHQNIINQVQTDDYQKGKNLHTTLCLQAQLYAESLLKNFKGGVVMMNNKGEILVNFSSPMLYVYEEVDKKNNYHLNKTLQERYPPGSIFKIISALSLLQIQHHKPYRGVFCSGVHMIGQQKFHCWQRSGHGYIKNIAEAIKVSCNIFFYENCYQLGEYAKFFVFFSNELGLNNKSQNILTEEITTSTKISKTKTQMMLCSIGQGFANATIIQMCIMITSVMTGNKISSTYTTQNQILPKLNINNDILIEVQKYIKSTFTDGGTCSKLVNGPHDYFGKTGTAQVMSFKHKYTKEHSIFVGGDTSSNCFIAMLVENAGFGSATAGRLSIQLLDYIRPYI